VLTRPGGSRQRPPPTSSRVPVTYEASGDTSQAMALLRKAAELDPADFRPWFALGRVLREQAQLAESALISAQAREESARDFAEAVGRSPPPAETREALVGLIGALLDISQHERAKNELEVLRRQAADDPQVMALGARLAHDLGRLDEAAVLADRALAIDRANREALTVRARVRFRMHQPDRAIEDLEAALAVKEDDLAALRLLSLAQKSTGRDLDAEATRRRADEIRESRMKIEKFSRLIAERPDDPEPRWRMGEAAVEAGLPALAFQSLQAALDLDPNCPQALEHLKKLRARGTSPELMSTVGAPFHGPSTRGSP
jgi:tetratricopeptide (TPR) repeat protein